MSFAATAKYPNAIAGVGDLLNHANFSVGEIIPTLAVGIAAGDSSFICATGTGANLPTDNFVVTIDAEIIFVGSRSGDTCTGLIRGFENTTAAGHSFGAQVNAFITAIAHNQLAAEMNAVESLLGVGGANLVMTRTTTLTATQIKNLSLNPPVILVPAPGPGKSIVPISAYAVYNPGTVPFNINTTFWNIVIHWDTTGVAPSPNVISNISVLQTSSPLMPKINFMSRYLAAFTGISGVATGGSGLGQALPPDNRALQLINLFLGSGAVLSYINVGAPLTYSIVAGGAGYAVNDVFTLTPPQGIAARYTVTSVDSNGGVLAFTRIMNTANSSTNAYFYAPQQLGGTAVNPSVGVGLVIKILSVQLGLNGIAASNVTAGQGGTGYAVNDTGTIAPNSGGSGTQTATYTVTGVSGGAVTSYTITATGTGYITAGGVATTKSTGVGSGFQIDITAIGGGYAPGDTGTWATGGTYTVGTVDANGNILTFSNVGLATSSSINNNAALATRGGSQPGVGTGLMFNTILIAGQDPTVGDGTLDIVVTYFIAG